jgi:hypothetical protein
MGITKTVTGALGALALLTACGGGGFEEESAETITSEAESAMLDLSSVRMSGDLTTDGEALTLDVQISTGGDCTGTIGLGGGDAELEILSISGETWMKPSEEFWQMFAGPQADQVVEAAGDRWVVLPASESENFAELCDLDTFLEELTEGDDDEGTEPTVGETEEVEGQEAVIVESETDEGDPVRAWVATEEPHYILKLEVTQGEEPGVITFSDFDEELDLEAPSDDEVFDISQLQ